ncbi:hypothetical protein DASC09_035830 [Saccharomycopsis crataegensis]|uniref:AB hydrolase-1 domain-containing protein n=1 Tax=Saccharomycopsis crataegensis TaxID=43959 RepID=A0AAV5QMZ8_9ASCO|nr:hypothetical protein DASC09_035830 [Saccharomycopsis crataegensis]
MNSLLGHLSATAVRSSSKSLHKMGIITNNKVRGMSYNNNTTPKILFPQSAGFEIIDAYKVKDVFNWVYQFKLPLFYSNPALGSIKVVAKITQLYEKSTKESRSQGPVFTKDDKLMTFLQGGPGFPSGTPMAKDGFVGALLDKGYTVVNYDQRGTGLSTPLEYHTLMALGKQLKHSEIMDNDVENYLQLIKCFRADSIINDCEQIRKILFKHDPLQKWSIQGQSYGGFCCHTYMSFYPDSLDEVLMTGGIPGIGKSVDDVYEATYKRTIERNAHYFAKYPQDIKKMKAIVKYLYHNEVVLPNGGKLTVQRFQQCGLSFGGSGGTDRIHQLVFKFYNELETFGFATYNTLTTVQDFLGFDTNVIYALFQEAIYLDGPGMSSNWSADRLRYSEDHCELFAVEKHVGKFDDPAWLEDDDIRVFFTGEMVFKSMFDDYSELQPFKKLAYAIHTDDQWSNIYDPATLHKVYDSWTTYYQKDLLLPKSSPKKVSKQDVKIIKVAAAIYYNDQYVDFKLSQHTIEQQMGSIRTYVTSEFFHNGLSAGTKTVMDRLFGLLDEEVD